MPQTCITCRHPNVLHINSALIAGRSLRDIGGQWKISKTALARHKEHLPAELAKAKQAEEVGNADTLLNDVRGGEGRADRLYVAAEKILLDAIDDKDRRLGLTAIKTAVGVMSEARQLLELRGGLTGELGKPQGGATIRAVVMMPTPVDPEAGRPAEAGRVAVELDLKR